MRKSIVFKWFLLTTVLFFLVFVFIVFMQNYFFEKYYNNEKLDTLKTYMTEYLDLVEEEDGEAVSEQFYKDYHVWITALDRYGEICDVDNYYIEVKSNTEPFEVIKIPMYSFEEQYSSDVLHSISTGDIVVIDVVDLNGRAIPYNIQNGSSAMLNKSITFKLHGPDADEEYDNMEVSVIRGEVINTVFPDKAKNIPFPYQEHLFLNQIKTFQTNLLLNSGGFQNIQELDVEENLVDYKVLIKPTGSNGEIQYIFAMISLQPVGEALSVMQRFLPYFIGFAFISVATLALFFTGWLSKPLTSINKTTAKIANMDFSEKLPVHSDDEIGELSKNINYLSLQMEEYISRLKSDLEKEQKLENTRKEFIAGVSHELKTPLAVIKSCVSAIRDGVAPHKKDRYLDAVESEIQQMDLLIGNMLDLAKFESGTYIPNVEPFQIDELIDEICESFSQRIQENEFTLSLNLKQVTVIGHRGLISRVVSNYLSNAISHTEKGGTIEVSITCSANHASILVHNEGAGIPEEEQDKIWNQFYCSKSRKNRGGTGLGLAITKEILELHHSEYGVKNTEKGVCFYFSLPIQS